MTALVLLLAGCAGSERPAACLGDPNLDVWATSLDGVVRPVVRAAGFDGFVDWSPDGSQLAFVASRDGNCEIYLAHPDGSGQKNLTNSPGDELHPSWSPDGSRIVFVLDGQIHTLSLDSGQVTQLTSSELIHSYPDWSPDGESITFSGGEEQAGPGVTHQVYTVPLSGGEETALTQGETILVAPRWSPDGQQIGYFDHGDPFQVWTMTADGSDRSVRLDGGHFSWSPDGSSLVHDREVSPGDVDIFIDGVPLVDGSGIDTLPDWSPDGTTILFSSDRP